MLIGRRSLLALAGLFGIGNLFQIPAEAFPVLLPRFRGPRRRRRSRGHSYTPNGKRECARRRRQIELGQLRVSA